jgi:hypothetical protein
LKSLLVAVVLVLVLVLGFRAVFEDEDENEDELAGRLSKRTLGRGIQNSTEGNQGNEEDVKPK